MAPLASQVVAWLDSLEHSWFAHWLGFSKWGYATVNTAHILGVALLVGSILPLDLKLMGAWPEVARDKLARILLPFAVTGIAILGLAGCMLFFVHAPDYGTNSVFQIKMVIVLAGLTAAVVFHLRAGVWVEHASPEQARLHGIMSMSCWVAALILGRMIAYSQL